VKVIDASALIKYVNRESGWERVQEYLLAGCITVDIALKELANALWKRVMRKELTEKQAIEIMDFVLKKKLVKLFPQEPLLIDALKFSIGAALPVYDALYIMLAKSLKTELITSDKKQAEKAEEVGINSTFV